MVPPDSPGISRVPGYSGYRRAAFTFAYGAITRYGAPSQVLPLAATVSDDGPTTPLQEPGTVWALPRSLAATDGVSFDFLSYGYLDVSVPRVRLTRLWIQRVMTAIRRPGFPIRTFPDQSLFAGSPRLIAGYHVLHRLQLPRHPPGALRHLTI